MRGGTAPPSLKRAEKARCVVLRRCIFYAVVIGGFPELRLLPGAGGRSPARRGAGGERGGRPSTPPAPPYSPFCGGAKIVSWMDCTPSAACRAGRRREPSRPCGPGDVRACCGAPSALRASGIAFAPATRCIGGRGEGGNQPQGKSAGQPCRKAAAFFVFSGGLDDGGMDKGAAWS